MKKILIILCFFLLLCGCKNKPKTSEKPAEKTGSVTVAMPQDDTVNGYRIPTEERVASIIYYANIDTMKFHTADCVYAKKTLVNHIWITTDRDAVIAEGYEPCAHCNP